MQIAPNKAVTIHYTLTDETGVLLDSTREREPHAYLHGHRNLLPALEAQLAGRVVGDTLSVTLVPEQAYGPRRKDATTRVPIKHLATQGKLVPGQVVAVRTDKGLRRVVVQKVGKFNVDVDLNHPLAGKTLVYEVEVVAVRDASAEELAHGHVHGVGGHQH
ncbi:MAG TPA: peptidylprolyl isomerase [Porticoccaceae bacterium]|jgi:FKBP-type peptidyl-prolyl cis-trans isomerase SlyD|nr:peptidylprolyl isomerase [Porticoccaceae bacterium]